MSDAWLMIREREHSSSRTLPDGRIVDTVTLFLEGTRGVYWEMIPGTAKSYLYIDGEPMAADTDE